MIATLFQQSYGDPADGGTVSLQITYDTVSLVVQQAIYNNPSSLPAEAVLAGPTPGTISLPADTLNHTYDLTPFNVACVQQTVQWKGAQRTITTLPAGESISFIWPA
jgi:hypothetical protein